MVQTGKLNILAFTWKNIYNVVLIAVLNNIQDTQNVKEINNGKQYI